MDNTGGQVGKFAAVGVINTLIDYVILNALVFLGLTAAITILGQEFLMANIISVFVAMVNSFILNKQWTFKSAVEGINLFWEIVKFLVITIIGMFIVHQIVFNVFYYNFPSLFSSVSHFLNLDKILSDKFVILNGAKSIAIIISLIWNFIGYKFIVFKR